MAAGSGSVAVTRAARVRGGSLGRLVTPKSARSSWNSRQAAWARLVSSPARIHRQRRSTRRNTAGVIRAAAAVAPNAMPTVAQPTPRFRPAVRAISRYRARATSPAAAMITTAAVAVRGRRRLAASGWPASARRAGGATIAIRARASTRAAITASATAAHGVAVRPAAEPADPAPNSPGRLAWPDPPPGRVVLLPPGVWVPLTIGSEAEPRPAPADM